MNKAQRNYDVYNRELLGLAEMCRHWRHYLHQVAHKVIIHTDHANLLFWKDPGDHNRRVARWHAKLMEYDFELKHIVGKRMAEQMHYPDVQIMKQGKKTTRN